MKYAHILDDTIAESNVNLRARYPNISFVFSDTETTPDGKVWQRQQPPLSVPDGQVQTNTVELVSGIPRYALRTLTTAEKEAILADYRYEKEEGGYIHSDGKTYQTHRESRADWLGALIQAQSNPAFTVEWKTADGSFKTLNALDVITIATAGFAHIGKCFETEEAIRSGIDTYTTEQQIKDAFDTAYAG